MTTPRHPGLILRDEILRPLRLGVSETAHHLDISRKTLSKLLNGRGAITPEMALRLELAFTPPAEKWLELQATYDLWQARTRGTGLKVAPLKIRASR